MEKHAVFLMGKSVTTTNIGKIEECNQLIKQQDENFEENKT